MVPSELVRAIVEHCWSDPTGMDRMATLVHADYVHHTPFGDGDIVMFRNGLEHVDTAYSERRYRVVHVIEQVPLVAAYLTWTATRRSDGSPIAGAGAYHCRLLDGLVIEDWDVFFPV